MDTTDLKILYRLQKNARVKASTIGQEVNMSVSAVIERIHRMEQSGVISRYTVVLNHKKLGQQVTAFVMVKTQLTGTYQLFERALVTLPYVMECNYIAGEFDFLIKVVAYNLDDVNTCVSQLSELEYVTGVKTHIVLSGLSVKDLPLPMRIPV